MGALHLFLKQGESSFPEELGVLIHFSVLALWLTIAWRQFPQVKWWRCALLAGLIALAWVPTIMGYRFVLFTHWPV